MEGCLRYEHQEEATEEQYSRGILYNLGISTPQPSRSHTERTTSAFRLVAGKHHPDLYSALPEFQKEQGYMEICVQELALGERSSMHLRRSGETYK